MNQQPYNSLYLKMLALLITTLISFDSASEESTHIKIGVKTYVLDELIQVYGFEYLEKISSDDYIPMARETAEIVIQLKALKLGGLKYTFEFLSAPNLRRAALLAKEQRIDITSTSEWSDQPDIDENVYIKTVPYIEEGESLMGFFTSPDNLNALKVKNEEELLRLNFASVDKWHVDHRALKRLGIKKIYLTNGFPSLARFLKSHQADVAIIEFNGYIPLMRKHIDNMDNKVPVLLKAIPNFKTFLSGKRVFLISRQSPIAYQLLEAMNKGIEKMRASGDLKAILTRAGYYPEGTEDWRIVKPKKKQPPCQTNHISEYDCTAILKQTTSQKLY